MNVRVEGVHVAHAQGQGAYFYGLDKEAQKRRGDEESSSSSWLSLQLIITSWSLKATTPLRGTLKGRLHHTRNSEHFKGANVFDGI